jgi:hypothetical protein
MIEIIVILLVILGISVPFFLLTYLGFHPEVQDKIRIDKIFNKFDKKIQLEEKTKVIKNLFIDSIKHVQVIVPDNPIKISTYSCEIALHIYALWLVNQNKTSEIDDEKIMAYFFAIKNNINIFLVKYLKRESISIEDTLKLIQARTDQIFREKDFETRHINFCNLCNFEIKKNSKKIFIDENINELPICPGSPFDMLILPTAYKSGLVEKYLELLTQAY